MPNNYFQFKQFKILQAQTAMKVSTDACILGALATKDKPGKILDIGTGTGLLALMLAQRYSSDVVAVESDATSYTEAKINVCNSPWSNRITLYYQRIQDFAKKHHQDFDLIVCNPPFYSPSPFSNDQSKHSSSLPFSDLLKVFLQLLTASGSAFLLLPEYEMTCFNRMVAHTKLTVKAQLIIKNRKNSKKSKIITEFSFGKNSSCNKELIIKNDDAYSQDFIDLMKDYYLFL